MRLAPKSFLAVWFVRLFFADATSLAVPPNFAWAPTFSNTAKRSNLAIFLFALVALFLSVFPVSTDAGWCNLYPPGQPLLNGVPRCPCGYFWGDNKNQISNCGSTYTGTPTCVKTGNVPPNGVKYYECATHPRCCCTSGGCCRTNEGMFQPSGYTCANSADCEGPRKCTGTSATCPRGNYQTGQKCRNSRGPCEADAFCVNGNYACPSSFRGTNYACFDPGNVPCQTPTYCTGSSYTCPSTRNYKPATQVCRTAATICERNSYCTGSGPTCPGVQYAPADTVCQISRGPCERNEMCTGSSSACLSSMKSSNTLCQVSRGPCESNRYCSGSGFDCPSGFSPASTKCANSTGPCENDRFCLGNSQFCPTSFKPTSHLCSVGEKPCESSQTYCNGQAASCPLNLKTNATICGVNPFCPEVENRCNGLTSNCENTPCNCPKGLYGDDCTCWKPAPSFLGPNPECRDTVWYSQDGANIVNTESAVVDGTIVIRGDYSQTYSGSVTLTAGSVLNITGCAGISGSVVVDLSNRDLTEGGANIQILYGCKVRGSEISGVQFQGYTPTECQLLNHTTSEVEPPSVDNGYAPAAGASGITVLFELIDDPECSQRSVTAATISAAAGLGVVIAAVAGIILFRRRRMHVNKKVQQRRLDALSGATTRGNSTVEGGQWAAVRGSEGETWIPELPAIEASGAALASAPRPHPPLPSHGRDSMPQPNNGGWHRPSVPMNVTNTDPNAANRQRSESSAAKARPLPRPPGSRPPSSHPKSRPLLHPPVNAGAAGATAFTQGDPRQRAGSRAARARPLPQTPGGYVAGASMASSAAAGGMPHQPRPSSIHAKARPLPRPPGSHPGGPRPNGPPRRPPPGTQPGSPDGDLNRQRAGSRGAKSRPLPSPPPQ